MIFLICVACIVVGSIVAIRFEHLWNPQKKVAAVATPAAKAPELVVAVTSQLPTSDEMWARLYNNVDQIDVAEAVINALSADEDLRKAMSPLYVQALATKQRHLREQEALMPRATAQVIALHQTLRNLSEAKAASLQATAG